MADLNDTRFRLHDFDAAGDAPSDGIQINTSRFRAVKSTAASEPLPTLGINRVPQGILNEEERSRIKGWWRFDKKPFDYADNYYWPDLAWRWVKRPYSIPVGAIGYAGQAAYDDRFNSEKTWEAFLDPHGLRERQWTVVKAGIVAGQPFSISPTLDPFTAHAAFSGGLPPLGVYPQTTPNPTFTTFLKFIWGGWTFGSAYPNTSSGDPLVRQSPPWPSGVYSQGDLTTSPGVPGTFTQGLGGGTQYFDGTDNAYFILPDPTDGRFTDRYTPTLDGGGYRTQEQAVFTVSVLYGWYDPGAPDAYKIGESWSYPIQSVISPDLFYQSGELDPANGTAGYYTLVITSDGSGTRWGMMKGHSGSAVEWFGSIDPFTFDAGPGSCSSPPCYSVARAYWSPLSGLGGSHAGGVIFDFYRQWNGWLTEYAISGEPFDTTLGDLGHVQPFFGYPHLDTARVSRQGETAATDSSSGDPVPVPISSGGGGGGGGGGSVPDTTPPALLAITGAAGGSTLVVQYSETLDDGSVPASGDWVVTVDGTPVAVTSVDVAGSTVALSMPSAWVGTETVLVDYTPGASPVKDLAGNSSTSYSGVTATISGGGGGGGGGANDPTNMFAFFKLGASISGYSGLARYGIYITDDNGIATANSYPSPALTYTNASQIRTEYSQGMTYSYASSHGYLLGQRPGDPGGYVFDHTNASLNTDLAQAGHDYCIAQGADGIYLDDVIPKDPYGFGGVTTSDAWRAGMVSFVHQLRDLLHASGKYLCCNYNAFTDSSLGNGDNGDGDVTWASMLLPDAVLQEGFAETRDGSSTLRSNGAVWNQLWSAWETVPGRIAALGITYIPLSYNQGGNNYTWASFLLIYETPMAFTYANDTNGTYITAHGDPGPALDARTLVGNVWRRRFTNFTVYVNPTTLTQAADGHSIPAVTALFV